jgi:hypothetical protein
MEQIGQHKMKDLTDAYLESLLEGLPAEEEIARQQVLSDRFLHRMDRLIRRALKQQQPLDKDTDDMHAKPRRMSAKRLLVAAIICAILASATSVYAYRKEVFRFIIYIYEQFSSISFQQPMGPSGSSTESGAKQGLAEKTPSALPQGYHISEQLPLKGFNHIIYINESGDELIFTMQEKSALNVGIDTEGTHIEEIETDGFKGLFYANKGQNNLVWEDDRYAYFLTGKISKNELIKMAILTK